MSQPQPSLDEAISRLGTAEVRWILQSGHAHDVCGTGSFRAHATAAELAGAVPEAAAYRVLANTREAIVWQACRSVEDLIRAYRAGSGRAMAEMRRRGLEFPVPAECQSAWL